MEALNNQVKKLEGHPGITPRIAHLFKLQHLDILDADEENELNDWYDARKANARVYIKVVFKLMKFRKTQTLVQQTLDLAAYANITPHIVYLLEEFFAERHTDEQGQEIDEWINESKANDRLFDMLLEFNFNGNRSSVFPMLR